MQINTYSSIHIKAARERVFSYATKEENLPKVFTGFGPVPAILNVTLIQGRVPAPGSVRLVENSDGSKIREKILQFTPPSMQEYHLESGFKPPFSWLVKDAKGYWTFEEQNGGVTVTWTFTFFLTNPMALPIALPLAKIFFQGAQSRCLQNIKDACEQ